MELDDILSEKPETPAEPQAPAEAPTERAEAAEAPPPAERPESRHKKHMAKEWEAQGRDPKTGQFIPKTEAAPAPKEEAKPAAEAPKEPEKPAAPAPTQQEMTDKERALLRAAEDERRKRQALEAELAKLRQPAQTTEQPKTFWDDPEGALKAHEQKIAQREVNLVLTTTERLARARHADFDEKIAEFADLIKATPGLTQEWLAAADPAEFAYVTGKNHLMLKQVGSIDELTEKVRKETEAKVRAQVEAEFKAKQEALEKERAALPPSLSDVRGGSSVSAKPQWMGPTPLTDILK